MHGSYQKLMDKLGVYMLKIVNCGNNCFKVLMYGKETKNDGQVRHQLHGILDSHLQEGETMIFEDPIVMTWGEIDELTILVAMDYLEEHGFIDVAGFIRKAINSKV